jgi:hypothetical protein
MDSAADALEPIGSSNKDSLRLSCERVTRFWIQKSDRRGGVFVRGVFSLLQDGASRLATGDEMSFDDNKMRYNMIVEMCCYTKTMCMEPGRQRYSISSS